MAQATQVRVGVVHWIDHFVCCVNDVERWYKLNEQLLGAKSSFNDFVWKSGIGIFQDVARTRIGGFLNKDPMPPTRGVGKGLPRYGYYIEQRDVDAHLKRLEALNVPHGQPTRVENLGEPGISILWQDTEENQMEFWGPDVLPAGAMTEATAMNVGRISHAVFESRDLERTLQHWKRFCGVDGELSGENLVIKLGAGARVIYQKVSELQGRTTGMGLQDAHTALLVRDEDYFPNYRRIWAELPEYEFDPMAQRALPAEQRAALPPRTVLHPSPGGRRFHALSHRGDDFFDWDSNMFHFYGGIPIDGSMAVYHGKSVEDYVDAWEAEHGKGASMEEVLS